MHRSNTDRNMDPFHLGHMVSGDVLGVQLHSAAAKGHNRALKTVLKRGINVDYPNDTGQTPLFCACYANQEQAAQILLSYGANPNEKSNDGTTPIHANCYNGNISLLVTLIKAGGDLRLHDCDGKTANDWAMLQPDSRKRRKMVEFLQKSHLFAMTHSGRDRRTNLSPLDSSRSIIKMIKKRVSKVPSVKLDPVRRVHSMGFGRVYTGNDDHGAIVSTIPLVSESFLQHDNGGITFENGAYLVMESMTWSKSLVTVKRLHHESQPGGYIDMLITEMANMGKLRHPNILLLMGVCETNNLDNLVLVFERVGLGSLYYYLHQRLERLPTQHIRDILLQVCNGILFIHNQNFIHCALSSHAINLVNPYIAKIGNFEHMLESHKSDLGKRSSVSLNVCQNALYNWMAPELMKDEPATRASDVFSYSCIIWEMFQCEVPWDNCDAEYIKHKVMKDKKSLPMEKCKIPQPFKDIAARGLQLTPKARNIDFDQINEWICRPPNLDSVNNDAMFTMDSTRTGPTNLDTSPDVSPVKMNSEHVNSKNKRKPMSAGVAVSGDEFSCISSEHSDSAKLKCKTSAIHSHPLKQKQRYEQTESPSSSLRSNHPVSSMSKKPSIHTNENHNYGSCDMHEQRISHSKRGSTPEFYFQESGSDECNCSEKFYDSPRKSNYGDNSGYKLTQFSTGKSNWTCEISHKHDGDQFGYAADIQKIINPEDEMKKLIQDEAEGLLRREAELHDSQHTSPVSVDKPSMFSYMTLNQNEDVDDRRHGVCKPACHRVSPIPPKTNTFKLSSAGSLYALYNTGTQLEEITRQQMSASLPQGHRLRDSVLSKTTNEDLLDKENYEDIVGKTIEDIDSNEDENDDYFQGKKWSEADPSWYGGKGSVRNLVNVYQDQVEDHIFQQSVLEGKFSSPNFTKNIDYQNKEIDLEPEKEMLNQCKLHPRSYVEERSKKTEIVCLHSAPPMCSEEPESLQRVCHSESELCGLCTESVSGSLTECPAVTIVTTVVSPEPNLNPETCISLDSVLLDSWICGGLEKLRNEIISDQAKDIDDENDLCLNIFNEPDENIEDTTKQIPKDLEEATWKDKVLKIGDGMCGGDLDRNLYSEFSDVQEKLLVKVSDVQEQNMDRNDNNGYIKNIEVEDTPFVEKLVSQEQNQTGCEIMDVPYQMSKEDSEGSLLKEVMEELSKSQARRRARQRILRKELDLKQNNIDDDNDEKPGMKLDDTRLERCQHKNWTFPRVSSESGMSEKPIVSGYIGKSQEIKHERRKEKVKPITYPKPTVIAKPHRTKKQKSKGYTTTVTVQSSLVRPGEHRLKHTATDLDTGETKTLHEQKVRANSVISTLSAH